MSNKELGKEELLELYREKKLSMRKIAKICNKSYTFIRNKFIEFDIKRRDRNEINRGQFQKNCIPWNKGEHHSIQTIRKIKKLVSGNRNQAYGKHGENSHHWKGGTRSDYGRIIWERANKRKVPKGFVIHHIDRNRQNNKIENLQLLSYSDHAKIHKRYHNLLHEVDNKFIERWSKKLINHIKPSHLYEFAQDLKQMLTEAGVKVVSGKEDK